MDRPSLIPKEDVDTSGLSTATVTVEVMGGASFSFEGDEGQELIAMLQTMYTDQEIMDSSSWFSRG